MDTVKTIILKGNPDNPESAEHNIEFPGGSISVCRTSKNEYWAHIAVNKEFSISESRGKDGAIGEIVGSRLDYEFPHNKTENIPNTDKLKHLAVRIKTK